ncbi:MAG: hypothetical protein RI883_1667 [Bacteroidota bacterium]|jgi:hypothetical protein
MKNTFKIVTVISFFTFGLNAQVDGVDSTYVEEETYYEETEDTNRVDDTFYSTRVINGHSVETLRKGVFELRIEHRFGDLAGTDGGVQTMFGFDNLTDMRIALEYGITDDLMVGFGRSKGTGAPYRSLMDGFAKYRIFRQEKHGFPFSLSAQATMNYTYMTASSDVSQVNHFPEWQHRLAYSTQLNFARKFGERLSLALMPTLVHRNYVAADDVNTIFALGGALRFGINSKMAILLEYYQTFQNASYRQNMTNSLGVAFEWITFGHNFTINFTNSKGFGDTQFITYTQEDWLLGQFRLGFCVGRKFEGE